MRRPLTALPFVLASALLLAGCAGAPTSDPTTDPTVEPVADVCSTPSGDASSAIEVTGEFGSEPTVVFDGPLDAATTERQVVIEGEAVAPGTEVLAAYAIYDGSTGEPLEVYGWAADEEPVAFRADTGVLAEGFARTLGCLGPGSRAVGVIPPAEGFGDAGVDAGLAEGAMLVFVIDVLVDLSPAAWTTGLPEIDDSGDVPVLTLSGDPKPELELTVLTEGDGAVVSAIDTVTVNYLGTAWETGEVFDESFSSSPASFSVQGVVPGFSAALIGQKVGSRVLVTMPPSLGYGEAGTSDHALAGLTLVFLIDIVDTTAG